MKTQTIKIPVTCAFSKLIEMDNGFIGTENYMGLAYFWHYSYRHYLRDCSPVKRKKIHAAWLKADLALIEKTPAHDAILRSVMRIKTETI